jgi:hypothetical protein
MPKYRWSNLGAYIFVCSRLSCKFFELFNLQKIPLFVPVTSTDEDYPTVGMKFQSRFNKYRRSYTTHRTTEKS